MQCNILRTELDLTVRNVIWMNKYPYPENTLAQNPVKGLGLTLA